MIPQPEDYKIHYDKYNDDKCTEILTIFIIRTKKTPFNIYFLYLYHHEKTFLERKK